jgi:hypothetical protein
MKNKRGLWIGYPDAETPVIVPDEDIFAYGPRGAKFYVEVSPEYDALVEEMVEALNNISNGILPNGRSCNCNGFRVCGTSFSQIRRLCERSRRMKLRDQCDCPVGTHGPLCSYVKEPRRMKLRERILKEEKLIQPSVSSVEYEFVVYREVDPAFDALVLEMVKACERACFCDDYMKQPELCPCCVVLTKYRSMVEE